MSDDIQSAFDNEQDLHDSFANEQEVEPISQTESAVRGAVQGATMGFSDEAAGALGAAGGLISHPIDNADTAKLAELYRQYRDIERQKNELAKQANPKSYLAGNVAGGAAGMYLGTGELGATLKGATALGALGGLGSSNADLTKGEYGRAAVDTGIGGALGFVGGKVAQKVGKMLSPDALQESATESVGSAIGAKGLSSQKQKIGEAAIKSGIFKTGLSEDTVNAMRQTATSTEGELQPLLQQVKQGLSSVPADKISEKLGGDAGDKVLGLIENSLDSMKDMSSDVTNDFAENIAPRMQDYVLKLKQAGNDPVRLNEIKRAAYQEASDAFKAIKKAQASNQPISPDFEKWANMAKTIGTEIKDHIEGLAGIVNPDLEQSIASTNQSLGGLSEARRTLTSTLTKGTGDFKSSSPFAYLTHPKLAAAYDVARNLGKAGIAKAQGQMGLANVLDKTVGESLSPIAQTTTALASRSTPMMESTQQLLGGKKPDLNKPAELSRSLYGQSDEQLKSIADTISQTKGFEHVGASLNNALANKDIAAKNAALFLMSSNPQTRAILKERGLIAE